MGIRLNHYETDEVRLEPLLKQLQPRLVPSEDVHIIGKVLGMGIAARKAGVIQMGWEWCKIWSFQFKIAFLEANDKRESALYPARDVPAMVVTVPSIHL